MEERMITDKVKQACFLEASQYQKTADLFRCTPTENVLTILSDFPIDIWEEGKTFIDPECGIGQFIIPAAIIKQDLQHTDVLSSVFGIDIKEDLVMICRERLLDVCGHTDQNIEYVRNNIVHADSLTYKFLSQ
jgi:SAM-dependent methyltransferase